MNLQPKYIFYGVILLVFGLLCFTTGRRSVKIPENTPEAPRVDTLIVRDTITRETPVFSRVYVRDTIYLTLTERDTTYIALPREIKVYEDSLYRAEISGYEPSLDRIDIYAPVRTITKTVTRVETVRKKTPWGVGVQVGYGITKQGDSFRPGPYVGVGIQYSIIRW